MFYVPVPWLLWKEMCTRQELFKIKQDLRWGSLLAIHNCLVLLYKHLWYDFVHVQNHYLRTSRVQLLLHKTVLKALNTDVHILQNYRYIFDIIYNNISLVSFHVVDLSQIVSSKCPLLNPLTTEKRWCACGINYIADCEYKSNKDTVRCHYMRPCVHRCTSYYK